MGIHQVPVLDVGEGEYESVLELSYVEESHYGEYVCRASNSLGAGRTVVTLVRKSKPETPTLLEAMEVGSNAITVTWAENFNGGYNSTVYKLQYRELGGSIAQAREMTCQSKGCILQDLKQNTNYIIRLKAENPLGESNWSEQLSVITQIDASQIPRAESLYYEKTSRSTSFKVASYPLHLMAQIEVMNLEGGWVYLRDVPLQSPPYKYPISSNLEFQSVRLRLCLAGQDLVCGPYSEASIVDRIQEPLLFSGENDTWLVAVIIGVLVTAAVFLTVLVKCCLISRSKQKSLLKKQEFTVSKPDLLNTTLSYDKLPALNQEMIRPASSIDQNIQQKPAGDSVNSQDSLWNITNEELRTQHQYRMDADYAHYPQPEEYLADMTSQYLADTTGYTLAAAKGYLGDPGRFSGVVQRQYFANNGDRYAIPDRRNFIQGQFELNLEQDRRSDDTTDTHRDTTDTHRDTTDTHRKVIREIIV